MRTTIDIPNRTYRQLKAKAASQGRSVKALLLEAAEQVLSSKPRSAHRVRLPLVQSRRPGSLELDNARIYDVIAFPDINVWVALTHAAHVHHLVAHDWFESLDGGAHFCFCRFTQLGLLRLLTAEAVMGDEVLGQTAAWRVYDQWLQDDRVTFVEEPAGLERKFRARSRSRQPASNAWADAYLGAFADAAGLTLVTFDRGVRGKVAPLVLLSEA